MKKTIAFVFLVILALLVGSEDSQAVSAIASSVGAQSMNPMTRPQSDASKAGEPIRPDVAGSSSMLLKASSAYTYYIWMFSHDVVSAVQSTVSYALQSQPRDSHHLKIGPVIL